MADVADTHETKAAVFEEQLNRTTSGGDHRAQHLFDARAVAVSILKAYRELIAHLKGDDKPAEAPAQTVQPQPYAGPLPNRWGDENAVPEIPMQQNGIPGAGTGAKPSESDQSGKSQDHAPAQSSSNSPAKDAEGRDVPFTPPESQHRNAEEPAPIEHLGELPPAREPGHQNDQPGQHAPDR